MGGTRNKYAKKYRCKGEPGVSRYLVNFKRGDFVDIVVDGSIHKGMPYSFYHGKTGIVFNVNRNALGVDRKKQDAKLLGLPVPNCKRTPEGPKEMKIVKAKKEDVEVLAPLPFIENYF